MTQYEHLEAEEDPGQLGRDGHAADHHQHRAEGQHSSAVVTALVDPKVLPTNEMNPPVDGWTRENRASVLPSSAIAIPATTIVSGAAIPAVKTRKRNRSKSCRRARCSPWLTRRCPPGRARR